MSRNNFLKVKSYFYVCDKKSIDEDDKWAMLLLLAEVVKKKACLVGAFAKDFNVDKQMVPYFGRQFCKMFLRDNNKFD